MARRKGKRPNMLEFTKAAIDLLARTVGLIILILLLYGLVRAMSSRDDGLYHTVSVIKYLAVCYLPLFGHDQPVLHYLFGMLDAA